MCKNLINNILLAISLVLFFVYGCAVVWVVRTVKEPSLETLSIYFVGSWILVGICCFYILTDRKLDKLLDREDGNGKP